MHHLDRGALRLSGGRWTVSGLLTGLPVVMLTTMGARSGQPRSVPLLYIRDAAQPEVFALIATRWGQGGAPAWYYNLKANPRATGVIDGVRGTYVAREATGAEYDRYWRLGAETYIGYPRYKARLGERHIPIMVLAPEGPGQPPTIGAGPK
jgi:deazaflavin-dependent oxidoreductase (nitroreductase family)